jgi:hypothetical protein
VDVEFSGDKADIYADDVAVELDEAGDAYTVKSMLNPQSIVNLTITRLAPGFQVGTDGKTLYGTDLANPWGSMRHAFWPRCRAAGQIVTKDGPIDFRGRAMVVYALQGMKPHHAAARWNFVNFAGPTHSAVLMEFTTPPSYGSTVVSIGGVATDREIITAGPSTSAAHTASRVDETTGWPEPTAVRYTWSGQTRDGRGVEALIEGPLGARLDKIDLMAQVPGFVKEIIAGTIGTKPYIYQYAPRGPPLPLRLKLDGAEEVEEGVCFIETTFL